MLSITHIATECACQFYCRWYATATFPKTTTQAENAKLRELDSTTTRATVRTTYTLCTAAAAAQASEDQKMTSFYQSLFYALI